jgi:hypothetical protein
MATVRKRSWRSGGKVKTAWICDYADEARVRRLKTFRTAREARSWLKESRSMIHTETTNDFERKKHYQNMKKDLFIAALQAFGPLSAEPEPVDESESTNDDLVELLAKKMFRSITEERWGSEPIEELGNG